MATDHIPNDALLAHSVAEAYLYLQFAHCGKCGKSPLQAEGQLTRSKRYFELPARCKTCREATMLVFDIQPEPSRQAAQSKVINPTGAPSQLIDIHGWLSMFQQIISVSGREQDATASRELVEEAASCLDEALKFYRDDSEVPPPEAFFSDAGRAAFRKSPERYTRSTWMRRRLQLPVAPPSLPLSASSDKRWWQFWR